MSRRRRRGEPGRVDEADAARDDVVSRSRELRLSLANQRLALAALASAVAETEEYAARVWDSRAETSSRRANELTARAEAARRFAHSERALAAFYTHGF